MISCYHFCVFVLLVCSFSQATPFEEEDKKARAGPFRKVVCGIRRIQESLTAFPWGTPISSLSDSMHGRMQYITIFLCSLDVRET